MDRMFTTCHAQETVHRCACREVACRRSCLVAYFALSEQMYVDPVEYEQF